MGRHRMHRKTPPKKRQTKRAKSKGRKPKAAPVAADPEYWLVEGRWGWRRYPVRHAPRLGRRIAMEGDRIVGHLPKDLLRANPGHQVLGYGSAAHVYGDCTSTCRRCRQSFVFSAQEQRFWYEVAKIPRHVFPARCAPCRRAERERKKGWPVLMAAVPAWRAHDTPATREAVVRATHAVREDVGVRALRRAIGLARKLPDLEAFRWDLRVELGTRVA